MENLNNKIDSILGKEIDLELSRQLKQLDIQLNRQLYWQLDSGIESQRVNQV